MALPNSSPRFHVLLLTTLVLCLCIPSFGQSENATVSGTISDPTGAAVQGVQVKLTNVNTGITATVPSNETGLYVFFNVHPGQYRMTVEKAGFRQVALTDLTLNVQDVLSRNFKLQLGVVGESVTVSGSTETVNTTSASVSTLVDQQFVENMPLNGRSFQSLVYLAPGVVITTATQSQPGQFSTNGQRTDANYFTIDGVSANVGTTPSATLGQTVAGSTPALTSGGGTNGLVSVDDMQEFRIQTSSFAAEFGRSPGAQISIVTKSGTNRWHGTAYDYLRNDVADARNWFNVPPQVKPPLRQNDFGGTIGGPVWKDRTFFFFSYEGLRLLQPNVEDGYFLMASERANVAAAFQPITNSTPVPDANANLANPACGAAGANPDPRDPLYLPCMGEIKASYSDPSKFNAVSLRIDHNLTKNVSLFARYNHVPSSQGSNSFQELTNQVANTDTMTGGLTWTLSPTLVNDFRGNWSKASGNLQIILDTFHGATIPSQSALYPPGFTFANAQAYYNFNFAGQYFEVRTGSRDTNTQRQLNFVDTLSKSIGSHQLKFGVDWRRMKPTTQTDNGDGVYVESWPSLQTGNADFLLTGSSPAITAHMDNWSFFGQDTWKVSPRLTLTYGLRWEINTPPKSDTAGKPLYSIQGIFDSNPLQVAPAGTPLWSTQLNAFAPRFGGVFQIAPKTVIRGGFGLFYDLGYGGGVAGMMGGDFPYAGQNFVPGPIPFDLSLPAYQPLPFTTTITPNALYVDAVDPHVRLPLTYQWNAAFERELGKNQTITATYVGAYADKLLRQDRLVPVGSPIAESGGYALATRNAGYAHYNALQFQFMRRMTHGLQAMINYSYAHSSDLGSSDMGGSYANSLSQIVLPPLTRSDFDVRHSLSAAVSYQIPSPSGMGKAGHAALSGWSLDSVFRIQTPQPLNIKIGGFDDTGLYYSVNPDRVTGQPIWIADPTEPAGKALNPLAFAMPANEHDGNVQRNSIDGLYGIDQTDLALRRSFKITERVKLDARVEYFNIFNHPMFGGQGYAPYTFWGWCSGNTQASCLPLAYNLNPYFGKVFPGYTMNVGLGGGGLNGGQSALYAPGGPRSGQITLKITF